jgi:hypothetical protein
VGLVGTYTHRLLVLTFATTYNITTNIELCLAQSYLLQFLPLTSGNSVRNARE